MNSIIEKQLKVEEIYKQLNSTNSMIRVAEIIDTLDEDIAKLLLKKYIYARENY